MASALNVVLYHHARLPVVRYGGIERVVVWLARGLAELGHHVTLIAAPGTNIPEATTVPIAHALTHRPGGPELAPLLPGNTDVVHAFAPVQPTPLGLPFVSTLEVNLPPGTPLPEGTVAASENHARRHGLTEWVYNGLDPAEYEFRPLKQNFDLFLGRLHSVKGWRWAIAGARATGHPLVLAGGWRPSFRRDVTFVGKVGGRRKRELFADAQCFWMPVQWDEPFGIVIIEAMVSGTPVLGTRRGALPEIVTPESGALGDTLEELIALRGGLAKLDPEAIRAHVLQTFTHRVMAERYVELYRKRLTS